MLSGPMHARILPEANETRNARKPARDRDHGNQRKIMNRLIIVCLLAVLLAGAASGWGQTLCPDSNRPFPAPVSEVVEIINRWFTDQGYAVQRDFPRPGTIHLTAWHIQDEWDITVRPHSALAAVATIIHNSVTPSGHACRRLREYVNGDLLGTMPRQPPRAERLHRSIPAAVLDKIDSVVCIHTRSSRQVVQFSGFVIDPDGLALSTAHDLADRQQVTLTFTDGTRVPGIVTRLDFRLDLALVAFSADARAFVSPSYGRKLLDQGESVFSIGCPDNRDGTLSSGTINGPPRLIDDQLLWQVDMDIYPGSSGSPVFDDQGQLVAMVKGRYRGTATVGFLTPLETMIAFLVNISR
jgi:serine protease Do